MALVPISAKAPSTKVDPKSKLETRLTLLSEKIPGIRSKIEHVKGYTRWRLMCDYLVLRTYKNKVTIHTNGDLDHYECHDFKYDEIVYECSDAQFIANLLEHVDKFKIQPNNSL